MSTAPILSEYLEFLRHHRDLAEGTLAILQRHVEPFLEHLGDQKHLRDLTPAAVRQFVVKRSEPMGRTGKRAVCFATRSFLRFASMRGYTRADLVEAVPKIPVYSFARLPRALPWEEVLRIIQCAARATPIGKRDYAILLLLAHCGLRVGEVARLRLDDIDWRHENITLRRRKARRSLILPLTEEVGNALLDYLKHARPIAPHREIFLKRRRPHRPFISGAGIRDVVQAYMRAAGVAGRCAVPHALRHSLASRLLQKGETMNTIADVLGHASLSATSIYTKIDIEQLREVALDVPVVKS